MKTITVGLLALLAGAVGVLAQTNSTIPTEEPANDWKPATSNQPGKQYPQVNSEGRVRARIVAPSAQSVQLDIGGKKCPLTKGEDGAWIGDSKPQDEGFHYYQLNIDGASVPDPGSLYFYGESRWGSGVEIPANDEDFYALKNVPHGQLRDVFFFSKNAGTNLHCYVYTPPGYETELATRYPVLYLQHGGGEDETGWGSQGRAPFIMDNLIAAGKARPFMILMANSYVPGADFGFGATNQPAQSDTLYSRAIGGPGGRRYNPAAFARVLIEDLIPFVDANFRTLADQPHRAMAGLSMGGIRTRSIAPANPDKFSHIGVFSGGSIATNDIADLAAFKEKVKLVFVSYGSRELGGNRPGGDPKASTEALKAAGVNCQFYVSPDTAHEWQSWRRSLHEFAPLLFNSKTNTEPNPRAALNRPIVLGPDDKAAFDEPPAGFATKRDNVPHGKLEMIEYYSKTVGTKRMMNVYTPPGYSTEKKYPVLYLLHGIGGDETEWERFCTPDVVLDNMIADGKAVPMIIVMPNGRAQKNDRPVGNIYAAAPAFATFERDLLDDVIPAIESRYGTYTNRASRALAGLSMGGGQSLIFGLAHTDTFAWVGAFSSAPNTKPPAELVPDVAAAKNLKLLFLTSGNKDGLIIISQGVHAYLKEHGIPHVWHVDGNGHDPTHWRNSLFQFAQMIFR